MRGVVLNLVRRIGPDGLADAAIALAWQHFATLDSLARSSVVSAGALLDAVDVDELEHVADGGQQPICPAAAACSPSLPGGQAHHNCVVIYADGTRLLSQKIPNDEPALLDLVANVLTLGDGDEVVWATDLNHGGPALLIALLVSHGQSVLYIPGRTLHHASPPGGRTNPRTGSGRSIGCRPSCWSTSRPWSVLLTTAAPRPHCCC